MSECKWNFEFYENSVKLSSVKLLKKLSKLIFPTISVAFWTSFGKFMSVTILFAIRDKLLFWNVIDGNAKIKVEIKVIEEYKNGTTSFVIFFTILITHIDDLNINANNVIDWHFADRSFFSGI